MQKIEPVVALHVGVNWIRRIAIKCINQNVEEWDSDNSICEKRIQTEDLQRIGKEGR